MPTMTTVRIKHHPCRKRLSVYINYNGEIEVRAPQNVSRNAIDQWLTQHQDWIKKQQDKWQVSKQRLTDWYHPKKIIYRGTPYTYLSEGDHVRFETKTIRVPNSMGKEAFIAKHARLYLKERCLDIAQHMGVIIQAIRIRKMKSCWGTYHRNQTITLNQALIQVPDWVSDYVMVHECAHATHFNHSAHFWSLVNEYTDHTKSAKKWLKDHQMVLI